MLPFPPSPTERLIQEYIMSPARFWKQHADFKSGIGNYNHVFKVLQLLVSSDSYGISLSQAAELFAIVLDSKPQFDVERRLVDLDDLLSMCSVLVTCNTSTEGTRGTLKFAHRSVEEYLTSQRIQHSTASRWYINRVSCHLFMAQAYIAYLLFLEAINPPGAVTQTTSRTRSRQLSLEYPLVELAAAGWPFHLSLAENNNIGCDPVALELFRLDRHHWRSWIVPDQYCHDCNGIYNVHSAENVDIWPGAMWFAAHHNLPETVDHLLALGISPNTSRLRNHPRESHVNRPCVPLIEASRMCHVRIMRKLLANGADVNIQEPWGDTAMTRAFHYHQDPEAVCVLLDNGADPNLHSDQCKSALSIGLQKGISVSVAALLLNAGADVHGTRDCREPNHHYDDRDPIEWAVVHNDSLSMVRLLLDNGADGTLALLTAVIEDRSDLLIDLLELGVDVNARAPIKRYPLPKLTSGCTALEAACAMYDPGIVSILLSRGANPNLYYDSALSALEYALNHTGRVEADEVLGLRIESKEHLNLVSNDVLGLLLLHGADLGSVREERLTPYAKTMYTVVCDTITNSTHISGSSSSRSIRPRSASI